METRARYALIGLFMLAVIAGSFAFVYWLENKGGFGQRETYKVRFEGPVSGLSTGSPVLFNGLRVGEVTGLSLNPGEPQTVIATIAVQQGTPIRDDTKVGLEQQGLSGGAAVTLRGAPRRRRCLRAKAALCPSSRRHPPRGRTGPRPRATPSRTSTRS